MKYSTFTMAVLACSALSGCGFLFGDEGYFRDRSDDYLKAKPMPPMEVPGNVDGNVLGQLYTIPDVSSEAYQYPDEFEVPRPEALSTDAYSENVKIQKLGDKSWIFTSASPSEVWPRVRNFLNANGLQVTRTDAPRGLIETAWLTFKDDPDNRDKYRLRIEQGIQPESAEIHVIHVSMPRDAAPPEQITWPERSSSDEKESWMIQELAANLAAEIGSASASLLAQTIGGGEKISIVSRNQQPVLRMELELVRAWASLNHALQQEGLQILDQDSDAGIYYVAYSDPEESDGFFSGWFSGDNTAQQYRIEEVLSFMDLPDTPDNRDLFPPAAFEAGKQAPEQLDGYLVLVKNSGSGVDVHVRNARGRPLESRTTRELLTTVRRNLI
ncbi:outer membrane protein assembly factor BamC [Gilvimarinus sp. F26214L]|uniref:outer membrane protein assembly factor BamC n=1 Tax=Gilvimarinus sp. DZF01 TaxID=3461371 RepID=UPI004045E9FE